MEQATDSRNRKKVLMVALFPPPFSSGERMLNAMINNILQKRYDVTAINFSADKLSSFSFSFGKIKNQFTSLWLFGKAVLKVKKLLKSQHFHYLYFVTPQSTYGHLRDWFLLKTIGNKIPYKFAFIQNGQIHTTFQKKWHKRITQSFIKNTSFFVFLTKGLAAKSTIIPGSKKVIIPNTADASIVLDNEEIKNKIENYNPGNFTLLYLSNMTPSKGYMDAANAIKILVEKNPAFIKEAHFVGEWLSAEDETAFREFVSINSLQQIIKIHGKISDRKLIKQFHANASVFLLPTYFSHEAQPVSIIESLNAATPVIATNHASIPEFIIDGENGFLVEKKSPQQIALSIEKLLQPECWKKMAMNARKSFEEKFSYEKYEEKIFDLFELRNSGYDSE